MNSSVKMCASRLTSLHHKNVKFDEENQDKIIILPFLDLNFFSLTNEIRMKIFSE